MEKQGKVLIVDDNEDILFALNLLLEPLVEKVKVTTQPARIEHFLTTFRPDVIFLDMNFHKDAISGQEGFYYLQQILKLDPGAIVILITAYADTEKAVRAIKEGATDFIPKPWEKEKLLATLSSALRLSASRQEVHRLREQVENITWGETTDMIGTSAGMQQVFAMIEKLAHTDANILILGENGTGKDLVARALCRKSPRAAGPFITIDLGSIPESLFESELFGYEKGAFTDARKAKAGRMEMASGGTLFLDEIGNLSLPMQAKLLTALEKRHISRLGSTHSLSIDVRLICATNAHIRERVREGTFRQDLLYRINTIEIHLPPLRERGEDILLLADHFREYYNHKYKKKTGRITREARRLLMQYPWPGNVRELQHVLERAVILSDGEELTAGNFMLQPLAPQEEGGDPETLNLTQVERSTIQRALKRCGGNLSQAASLLGITRYALYRKIEKLEL